jgi:hypothetical protein
MSRDLRRYARQTNIQLLAGFLLILFVVGETLIYNFYGRAAAIFGFLCLLGGTTPLILIWLVLNGLEYFVKRANAEDDEI